MEIDNDSKECAERETAAAFELVYILNLIFCYICKSIHRNFYL